MLRAIHDNAMEGVEIYFADRAITQHFNQRLADHVVIGEMILQGILREVHEFDARSLKETVVGGGIVVKHG